MKSVLLLATLVASVTFGQTTTTPNAQPRTPEELKAALGLSDSQITSLQGLQEQKATANRTTFETIRARQQTLETTLAQTNPDPTALGQLLVEIKTLRAQIQANDDRFRQQALALLTADQRTKLAPLESASKLQAAVGQAIAYGLLDAPARPQGVGIGIGGPGSRFGGPGAPGFGPRMMFPRR
ncbi:MAG TPA: periplasmic heavy metal sensor [Bryobacteraceae bacterium]|jgi:DNA primase|nr:periplasmic heavy metal sensor [Bryobacteraceae bacterium]